MASTKRTEDMSPKFMQMAKELPAALAKITGKEWEVEIRYYGDGDGFQNAVLKQSDGFSIHMSGGWCWRNPDRGEFSILWPRSTDGSTRSFRDAPGVRYDAVSPTTSVSCDRPVAAVAKQIARVLLADVYISARNAMLSADANILKAKDNAKVWRDAVSQASGIPYTEGRHGEVFWGRSSSWGDIKSSPSCAGGTITLKLPSDPTEAAEMMAKLRELMHM